MRRFSKLFGVAVVGVLALGFSGTMAMATEPAPSCGYAKKVAVQKYVPAGNCYKGAGNNNLTAGGNNNRGASNNLTAGSNNNRGANNNRALGSNNGNVALPTRR